MIRFILSLLAGAPLLAAADNPGPAATPPAPPAEQFITPPEPGRFRDFFRPFRTDRAALSPDGKYLAFSLRDGNSLSVTVIEIDHPEKATAHVRVIDDEAATPMLAANQREPTPARINWMRWATPTRLVVETNRVQSRSEGQNWQGAVVAFDADGGNARQIASPDDVYEFIEASAGPVRERRPTRPHFQFNGRVWLPDEPVRVPDVVAEATPQGAITTGGLPGFMQLAPLSASLAGQPPSPETASNNAVPATGGLGEIAPRNLRIFDLDPARPGAVTLVASGVPRTVGSWQLGLYSVDAVTGKLTSLTEEMVPRMRTPRIDRRGRVRLLMANNVLSDFPLKYEYYGLNGRNPGKPLDAASGLSGFTVTPDNFFGQRSIPLGFDEKPEILYYASNVGRDTYGIYSLNLTTGQRGGLVLENPAYDLVAPAGAGFPDLDVLVFDRFTHQLAGIRYEHALRTTGWLKPEMRGLQEQLEKSFPGRSVEIIEWDQSGNRFLFFTEGPADAGAFYVYDRAKGRAAEFVRRAPWIDARHTHASLAFAYAAADGARISGLVTVPNQPHLKPIPMVVLCPDLPWQRVRSDFQTEVQALADMGFAVVQLNGRGAWGLGLKQRQSLTAGYDLVQVEDIVTTVTRLEEVFHVNPRRVALVGRGHGGFIALRALQEHPDRFRCAIALEAPVNLAHWIEEHRWAEESIEPLLTRAWLGDETRLKAKPLVSRPEAVTKPVLLLNYPGADGEVRHSTFVAARNFAGSVRHHGGTAAFGVLHHDYLRGLPQARAEVFGQIEEFLNLNIYDFRVKLPEMKVVQN